MLNPFTWIRRKAAEAVVLGTGDGLKAITPEGEEPPSDLGELRAMLAAAAEARALPAHEAGEEGEAKGKKARAR